MDSEGENMGRLLSIYIWYINMSSLWIGSELINGCFK